MWIIFLCAIWFTLFVGGICLPLEMEMPLHRGPATKCGWIWPLAYPICAWSSGFSPLDSMIDFFRFVPCWTCGCCGLPGDYEIFLVLISAFCVPLNLNLVFWMFQGKRSEPSPLALDRHLTEEHMIQSPRWPLYRSQCILRGVLCIATHIMRWPSNVRPCLQSMELDVPKILVYLLILPLW
jgi:hypothetical protein